MLFGIPRATSSIAVEPLVHVRVDVPVIAVGLSVVVAVRRLFCVDAHALDDAVGNERCLPARVMVLSYNTPDYRLAVDAAELHLCAVCQ